MYKKIFERVIKMTKTKLKRGQIRLITFTIALILCLGISVIILSEKSKDYEYRLRAAQQNSVISLSEYVDNIATELHKGLYASSPSMVARVSSKLSRDCSSAKSALSQISAPDSFLENTYKFLSQVGDFTYSINSKLQRGEAITDTERSTLNSLLNYATRLSDSISELISEYENPDTLPLQTETINTSLTDLEQSFSDYPTLIYDGPFSDHMGDEDAGMLDNLPEISEPEAKEYVARVTGIEKDSLLTGKDESGTFDCYTYSTKSTSISVTKKGGLLCTIISSNRSGEAKITCGEAVEKGLAFLEAAGYKNMRATYHYTDDGICVINYAYSENGVVCYTDLIKVGVALDNGRVLSFDARGFIMNHKERNIEAPKVSEKDAAKKLAPNLSVRSSKLALIPSDSDKEFFCREFLCSGERGEDLLVYIDAEDGTERDILLLLYSDGGTMTK
mgnify:FL=1